MKKTKKAYEKHLNEYLSEVYAFEDIYKKFGHLKDINQLRDDYSDCKLGSVIRRLDPILFNVGYNEWR